MHRSECEGSEVGSCSYNRANDEERINCLLNFMLFEKEYEILLGNNIHNYTPTYLNLPHSRPFRK